MLKTRTPVIHPTAATVDCTRHHPLNTFRILFNCYFGASYPLLEDITYANSRPRLDWESFEFVPVNDRLRESP